MNPSALAVATYNLHIGGKDCRINLKKYNSFEDLAQNRIKRHDSIQWRDSIHAAGFDDDNNFTLGKERSCDTEMVTQQLKKKSIQPVLPGCFKLLIESSSL